MDWLTTVGVGPAALSGAGKTTLATRAVDALRASRLEGLLSRMSFAPGPRRRFQVFMLRDRGDFVLVKWRSCWSWGRRADFLDYRPD